MTQIRIWELPSLVYQDDFPVRNLPNDEDLEGNKPDKAFINFIKEHDGGLVPVFIQAEEGQCKVLHGGEIVRAVRAANLYTLPVLIVPMDMRIDKEVFLAYDRHGKMTLQEKVMEIQRLMSQYDLEHKEIARRVCLPPSEVKYCMRLASGNAQIIRAWLGNEVTTTVLRKIIVRPPAEQAILAEQLQLTGKLTVDTIREVRAELAKSTSHTLVPLWKNPDFGKKPMVMKVLNEGEGVKVEIMEGEETYKFVVPVEMLLKLKEEIERDEKG